MTHFQISLNFTGRNSDTVLSTFSGEPLIDELIDLVCAAYEERGIDLSYEDLDVSLVSSTIEKTRAELVFSRVGADADVFEEALYEMFDSFDDFIRRETQYLNTRGEGKFAFTLEDYAITQLAAA